MGSIFFGLFVGVLWLLVMGYGVDRVRGWLYESIRVGECEGILRVYEWTLMAMALDLFFVAKEGILDRMWAGLS